jgi:hypothetical protein
MTASPSETLVSPEIRAGGLSLVKRPVAGDGECGWSSILVLLGRGLSANEVVSLRHDVVSVLEEHRAYFSSMLGAWAPGGVENVTWSELIAYTLSDTSLEYRSIRTRYHRARVPWGWMTNILMKACAVMMERAIIVIGPTSTLAYDTYTHQIDKQARKSIIYRGIGGSITGEQWLGNDWKAAWEGEVRAMRLKDPVYVCYVPGGTSGSHYDPLLPIE